MGKTFKVTFLTGKLANSGIVCFYRSESPPFLLVVTALAVTADPQWIVEVTSTIADQATQASFTLVVALRK